MGRAAGEPKPCRSSRHQSEAEKRSVRDLFELAACKTLANLQCASLGAALIQPSEAAIGSIRCTPAVPTPAHTC